MPAKNLLFNRLVVLGIVCVPLSYYVNTLRSLHNNLSSQITHKSTIATADVLSDYADNIFSLPKDLSQSIILADEAVKVVQASSLPSRDEQRLLTTYLQYNMAKFAGTPQAWILWLLTDQQKKATFNKTWISSREFNKGDRICGDYIVMHRQPNQVEFKMSMGEPETRAYIEGRLVIGITVDRDRNKATFRTRTLMWRLQDSTRLMPLERTIPKLLHELASWGLIEQGVQHLEQLGELKN